MSVLITKIVDTEYVEGEPPWLFACPLCKRKVRSDSVVICEGTHIMHRPIEMVREWITVTSAMTGKTRYIEVLR